VELHRAGWPLDRSRDREYEVHGMPRDPGIGYAELTGRPRLPSLKVNAVELLRQLPK
jgi:hypothetical protein